MQRRLKGGKSQARVLARCRILLLSEQGQTMEKIANLLEVGPSTVYRTRKRYRTKGLAGVLKERSRSGRPKRFREKEIQHLVALACSLPPPGYARWTLPLLAREARTHKWVSAMSRASVGRLLRQHRLKPWRKKNVVRAQAQ